MSENERRVAEMGLRDEAAAVIVAMLDRLDALEQVADDKEGAPKARAAARAAK